VKYRTIVVDPPWAYNRVLSHKGANGKLIRGAASHYEVQTIADIAAIPVGEWAEERAHLYIWITNTHLLEGHGYTLAKAWGFDPKTILTWIKDGIGMGSYFRNSTEHVVFCARNTLPPERRDMPTHFRGKASAHSEKPAAFYDIVESMSPGPYLDVFARKLRFNWDAWGNEVGAPPGLPQPEGAPLQGRRDDPVCPPCVEPEMLPGQCYCAMSVTLSGEYSAGARRKED
jgi:N6-adenosine-specific RNA methylase IME4